MVTVLTKKDLAEKLAEAKDLTKNDIKRLERMKDDSRFDEFKEVIEAMLKENKKLEQEALI